MQGFLSALVDRVDHVVNGLVEREELLRCRVDLGPLGDEAAEILEGLTEPLGDIGRAGRGQRVDDGLGERLRGRARDVCRTDR